MDLPKASQSSVVLLCVSAMENWLCNVNCDKTKMLCRKYFFHYVVYKLLRNCEQILQSYCLGKEESRESGGFMLYFFYGLSFVNILPI